MTQNICIWAARVECLTYTLARTAVANGRKVYVMTTPKPPGEYSGHTRYYDKLSKMSQVQMLHQFEPMALDWLYIQPIAGLPKSELIECAAHAQHIGLVSGCGKTSLLRTLLRQFQEIITFGSVIWRVERSFFGGGFYPVDFYRFWMNRQLIGYDVHSNFFESDVLFEKMFAFQWNPEAKRKYRFNFIGNRKPPARNEIINAIKSYLAQHQLFPVPLDGSELIWLEYGDDLGEKRGVPPTEYLDLLGESDFTLSPPGYGKMTHRTMEALIQGSIPILNEDELELYDINLQDSVNCIAVKDGNWQGAMQRAIDMPLSQVIQMRLNILTMKDAYLSDAACNKRLGSKMGLL
jgi:hypothetical protein